MPAKQRQQPPQNNLSSVATAKSSSKYTNKDGSKFITIPKPTETTDSPEPSPDMAHTTTKPNGQVPVAADTNGTLPAVNKKKQKRREKERAKLAALHAANPELSESLAAVHGRNPMDDLQRRLQGQSLKDSYDDEERYEEGYETDEIDDYPPYQQNGHSPPKATPSNHSKRRGHPSSSLPFHPSQNGVMHHHISLPIPPLVPTNMPRGPGISKEKIWNTSSQEERERIKEFWLSLGEDERKSLVKVEKDAVLKKMKEQQKHSCSCTVCGRKRTAIEEELEVLYDAYYEELEQYANHHDGPPPMMPPPRRFGALSGLQPPHRLPAAYNRQQPSRGRIVEQLGDDEEEEDDEEYSDQEGDEDEYSEEEEPEELPRNSHATDFFNFGASLTVQGGILTVADDLLKNDGKKFIEMMEQLAERRMAREEDQRDQYNPNYGHQPNGLHSHSHNHNHPPPVDEDEYDDEEDDEEYESGEEDDYDEDEEMVGSEASSEDSEIDFKQDTMTEEQRMEEGRRMFQIFAARMFEQRVLTAYKEKIAKERQNTLIEELAAEELANEQKKAKKLKDAQKKKEKLAQKKKALADEKAKKDADKAAEEAEKLAAEQKKVEEQRQRAEEKRKKKEAQKRAEEEERQRKEAEKQKRLQDQRDKQAELERKQREAKEKERKEKEDQRQKEKEMKEREAKEKREQLEHEKQQRERQAELQKQAKDAQAAKDAKERSVREETTSTQKAVAQGAHAATQSAKRVQAPVPIPRDLQPAPIASPHIPVVTPAIPKAPTPIKVKRTTSSHHDSSSSLPATPQTTAQTQSTSSPPNSTPSQGSPVPTGQSHRKQSQPFLHQPQASSPIHSALKGPPGMQPSPFGGLPPMGFGPQPNGPPMASGFGRLPPEMYPLQPGRFAPPLIPNGMPFQHPMHHPLAGRGFPIPQPPPGFGHPPQGFFPGPKENGPTLPHSRQASGSFDKPIEPIGQPIAQPIARPVPIGRPGSTVNGQRQDSSTPDIMDDLSRHLGSSALLDDNDEPLPTGGPRRPSAAPGNINIRPPGFPQQPFGMDGMGFGSPVMFGNTWGQPNVFAGSPLASANYWPPAPGFGGPALMNHTPNRSVSGPIVARLKTIEACKALKKSKPDDFFDVSAVKQFIDQHHANEPPVSEAEILDILDTEGSNMNGGGAFDIRKEEDGRKAIRYLEDGHAGIGRPSEIGSPIIGSVGSVGAGRFGGGPPGF